MQHLQKSVRRCGRIPERQPDALQAHRRTVVVYQGMAKNKDDNIASQVGGWLGGAAKAIGSAAAKNPLVAQNIRYGKAALDGPATLAKTAAMDLAVGAAGAGVARGIGQAAKVAQANYVVPKIATKIVPSQKRAFKGLQDEMVETGYFDQGHGGLNAIYDPRKFEDVIERGYLTPRQVKAINKEAKRMRDESVYRNLENYNKRQRPK